MGSSIAENNDPNENIDNNISGDNSIEHDDVRYKDQIRNERSSKQQQKQQLVNPSVAAANPAIKSKKGNKNDNGAVVNNRPRLNISELVVHYGTGGRGGDDVVNNPNDSTSTDHHRHPEINLLPIAAEVVDVLPLATARPVQNLMTKKQIIRILLFVAIIGIMVAVVAGVVSLVKSNNHTSNPNTDQDVENILQSVQDNINNELLVDKTQFNTTEPSTLYRFDDLLAGLQVMSQQGVAGYYFYMGDNSTFGHQYGLVNIAAFLAQSMHETIQYDACDENSYELVNGKYPISNSCGQNGQNYQDLNGCEANIRCPVDTNMQITAMTNAKWWGAPEPLKCGPKSVYPFTGYWDPSIKCPGGSCTIYPRQQGGAENNTAPYPNAVNRTDVEGCCWWGRGVIATTGPCNFGILDYYLGQRAADDGRSSVYPNISFCTNPESVCSNTDHPELKWIAGMLYWMKSVQSYQSIDGKWNYMTQLKKFVDDGMTDMTFIDGVSGIVNRGCYNPPACGILQGGSDRQDNFMKVLRVLKLV